MSLGLSQRHKWVLQSEIRNMTIQCERMGGINLAQGVCDTEVPTLVRRAVTRAMDEGINTYTNYAGLPELRHAIAEKHSRLYGIDIDPESEIIVSAGSTGVFYCACLALLNPGDEVILFEPFYGYHVQTLVATGGVPAYVRMQPPGWSFSPEDLERAVTARTKGIMVNTPANPSGKVFSYEELELISDFARRHDLFVFTDEIYEHFIYDGNRHTPPMSLPGMRERTITISGVSKTFSITGWRVGYSICDPRWSQTIGHFNDLVYVCAPAPLQIGAAAGMRDLDAGYYERLEKDYLAKREKICSSLTRAGLRPFIPAGAYYVLADISRLPGNGSKERVLYLLEQTGVACVPGNAFYHDHAGEGLARFCFAKEDDILDEACSRLETLQ